MPDKAITNPQGAYGYTTLDQELWYICGEFKASAAIAVSTIVQLSTDGTVATATTNTLTATTIGATLRAVASGSTVDVVTQGIVVNVPCTGAISAGNIVKPSVTTAGSVSVTASPAAGEAIGWAVTASASNVATIWIAKSL